MGQGPKNPGEFKMPKDSSVCKLCRRAGVKLFLKGERCHSPKCPFTRRPYPPGIVGPKTKFFRQTDYGKQLTEKQRVRYIYNLSESQLRNYFKKALQKKEATGPALFQLLERRLDNLIYRIGVASSRREAAQVISHGFVKVNGKKVNIPSFLAKKRDEIQVSFIKKRPPLKVEVPKWLKFDKKKMMATVLKLPDRSDIKEDINDQLVIEYYSR